ncbi:MAG: HEAT repeat domain-containing protein [Phycisphaerales bacterium]|nr:HEAT repeat domain-containing protein [Phycisphaerales bacterium]
MISDQRPESSQPAPAEAAARKRISPLLIMIFVVASVALPIYFWQGTWFGTRLSNAQLAEYLADRDNPRHVQHALVQLTERLDDGPADEREFYPAMVALVDHPREQVRSTLAWAMGWDPSSEEFHEALRTLLTDDVVLVRRNAALALSKFGDDAARSELREMLVPYTVISPFAGEVSDLLAKGRPVKAHTDLARIATDDGVTHKFAAPLNGTVLTLSAADGDKVNVGDALCEIAPGQQDMWEALRALAIVGTPDDIPAIQQALNRRYADAQVAEQGESTIKLIEERAGQQAN